jgi:hypothetical protein
MRHINFISFIHIQVVVHILMNMKHKGKKLLILSDPEHAKFFRHVLLRYNICNIHFKHHITANDVVRLEQQTPLLMSSISHLKLCKLNNHFILHVQDQLALLGCPRDYMTFRTEGIHSKFLIMYALYMVSAE